jgi:hypothetical protein
VAEREAPGEFDYLIGDLTEAEVSSGDDVPPEQATPQEFDDRLPDQYQWDQPDDGGWVEQPASDDDAPFDAFDENTWYFEPAPVPWYRSKVAVTALIATAAAAIALVVSGVLLLVGGPDTAVDDSTTSVTPTAPTTVASSESETTPESPPPLPPPPPPPETSAEPVAPPAQTLAPRAPRPTSKPEIGVTRTPVTRSPLSVAPQRPGRG